jgi:hypothetical protein
MSAKSRFRKFRSKKFVEVQIDLGDGTTETCRMFPATFATARRCRPLIAGLVTAISTLTDQGTFDPTNATSWREKVTTEGNLQQRETEHTPPAVEELRKLSEIKHSTRSNALNTLLDEKNTLLLAELVFDALRDEQDISSFVESTDLPVLFQLLKGWLEANSGEGDLGNVLKAKAEELRTKLQETPLTPKEATEEEPGSTTTESGGDS